jgi:hypothetical protein
MIPLVAIVLLSRVQPVRAQAQNGISEPTEGDVVSGIVFVQGTATDADFLRYELAFNAGQDWIVFAEGDRPIIGGTLAIWDTTVGQPFAPVFPDGVYALRLRVVRADYNYDEYFVRNITLANSEAATSTPTATATTRFSTPATPTPSDRLDLDRPTVLPSLTPFPTPSRIAPSNNEVSGGGAGPPPPSADDDGGLLGLVQSFNVGRLDRAFWTGARLALYVFALVPIYLVVRAVLRRLWRELQRVILRRER